MPCLIAISRKMSRKRKAESLCADAEVESMESAKDGSMELGVDVSVESAEDESMESVKADETLEVLLSKAAYSPWVYSTLVHNADTISADPGCCSCDDGGRPPVDYSSSRVCIINTSKNRLQACQEVLICSLLAWCGSLAQQNRKNSRSGTAILITVRILFSPSAFVDSALNRKFASVLHSGEVEPTLLDSGLVVPCDGLCLRSFHIGLERGDDTGAPQYNRDACNVLQVPEDLAEYIKVSTELSCDSAPCSSPAIVCTDVQTYTCLQASVAAYFAAR